MIRHVELHSLELAGVRDQLEADEEDVITDDGITQELDRLGLRVEPSEYEDQQLATVSSVERLQDNSG